MLPLLTPAPPQWANLGHQVVELDQYQYLLYFHSNCYVFVFVDDRKMIQIQRMYIICLKDDKTARTSVLALMDMSKSYISICALPISGFANSAILYLSIPVVCIWWISTLLSGHYWISPKTTFVFSKSNHLHLWIGDIHILELFFLDCLSIGIHSSIHCFQAFREHFDFPPPLLPSCSD